MNYDFAEYSFCYHKDVKVLLAEYNAKKTKTFEDIIDLQQLSEIIYPFQDDNGREACSSHSNSA